MPSNDEELPSFDHFRLRFEGIRAGLRAIRTLAAERDRLESPHFNVFQVLGIHEREVKTHSAFLANLLDPQGTHGQGGLFMRAFLDLAMEKLTPSPPEAFTQLPETGWEIRCEVATDFGHIDIVLQNPGESALIVIENKIYAGDQERQLERYGEWMNSLRILWPKQAMLYLTLDGHAPRERPTLPDTPPMACIAYAREIKAMLERTERDICSNLVSTIVHQYIQLIDDLCGHSELTVTFDEAAAEFLSQKENFSHALEVARLIEQARRKIQDRLVAAVALNVEQKLPPGWRVLRKDREDNGVYHPGFHILPKDKDELPAFRVEHEWRFYHGIWQMSRGGEQPQTTESTGGSNPAENPPEGYSIESRDGMLIAWRYSSKMDGYKELKQDRHDLLREFIDLGAENTMKYIQNVASSVFHDFKALMGIHDPQGPTP